MTPGSEPRDVKRHQEGGLAHFPQWQIPLRETQHGSSLDLLGSRQIRQQRLLGEDSSFTTVRLLRWRAILDAMVCVRSAIESPDQRPHATRSRDFAFLRAVETIACDKGIGRQCSTRDIPELGDHPSFFVIPIARGQLGYQARVTGPRARRVSCSAPARKATTTAII